MFNIIIIISKNKYICCTNTQTKKNKHITKSLIKKVKFLFDMSTLLLLQSDDMRAVDDEEGSAYSMEDYEPSVGTFVGLPRQQVQDESGLKMNTIFD